MRDSTVKWASFIHTLAYRSTGGLIGRRLVANDMLLLTTTGRTTGRDHTVPLLYLTEGDRLVVIASYGGRQHHPDWYLNLQADPSATVQILRDRCTVTARTMDSRERAEWWPRVVDAYNDYAAYQSRTDREIPVVSLERHTP